MYFKVLSGTNTFNALCALKIRINHCNAQAKALVAEVGGLACYRTNRVLAGGVDGIEFDAKPDGWMRVSAKHAPGFFYPKEQGNRELLKRLASLPKVQNAELNQILRFTPQWVGLTHYFRAGVEWGLDYHLIHIALEIKYQPLPDMVEITASEYKRLHDEIHALTELGLPV